MLRWRIWGDVPPPNLPRSDWPALEVRVREGVFAGLRERAAGIRNGSDD